MKQIYLICSLEESVETQYKLFEQGYFWFYDDKIKPDIQLKGVDTYPVLIITNDNYMSWVPNEYIHKQKNIEN